MLPKCTNTFELLGHFWPLWPLLKTFLLDLSMIFPSHYYGWCCPFYLEWHSLLKKAHPWSCCWLFFAFQYCCFVCSSPCCSLQVFIEVLSLLVNVWKCKYAASPEFSLSLFAPYFFPRRTTALPFLLSGIIYTSSSVFLQKNLPSNGSIKLPSNLQIKT